jgi:transcription antitermination protein NusB
MKESNADFENAHLETETSDIKITPAISNVYAIESLVVNEHLYPEASLSGQFEEEKPEEESKVEFTISSRRGERVLAFNIIYAIDRAEYQVDLEKILEDFSEGFEVDISSSKFVTETIAGVVEKSEELDQLIKPFLRNWKLDRIGCCTHIILKMALWELLQDDAIASISINEAVELAKVFAEKDSFKFVNGILDEIYKQKILMEKEVLAK